MDFWDTIMSGILVALVVLFAVSAWIRARWGNDGFGDGGES